MIEDMTVRNFVEKTRHDYIRHVRTFTAFLGHSPDTAMPEDLRRFQLHQTQTGVRVKIENAAQWNMNSKRIEMQARWGDILITVGGGEGVHHLANLYHDARKPVVPLMLKICAPNKGSLRLFEFGLASSQTARMFRTDGPLDPHGWINRLNFGRSDNPKRVATVVELLECLRRPTAPASGG